VALYKRSIFVINPTFQYKFSFMVCSFALLTSIMYPWTIYDIFEKVIMLNPAEAEVLKNNRTTLFILLGAAQFGLLGLIFIVSIFISHKIAGPIYKLQNYLRNIREGGDITHLFFRNGDHFTEVADEVNQVMEYLVQQRQDDFQYLDEVSSYMANLALVIPEDKKPVLNEILSKLAEIRSRYSKK
jgi:sensor histidine kinase YesM